MFPRYGNISLNTERKLLVSASAMDDLLDCPFSYWCGNIANFERPRDEFGVFDRAVQGSVAHDIWQRVWKVYLAGGAANIVSALLDEWDGAVSALSDRYPGLCDRAAVAVLAELRGSMISAAEMQDEIEARACAFGLDRERTEFERRLPPYELENVIFTGRADRIDVWKGIGAVIVDYKLGASDKYKNSLQLAVYAAMMRQAGERAVGFGFIGHRDGKIRGSWSEETEGVYRGKGRTRDKGFEEKMAEALEAMKWVDSVVASGAFAANYESRRCSRCDWITLCRRAERRGAYEGPDEGEDEDGGNGGER
jgi:RecB family exonuclease